MVVALGVENPIGWKKSIIGLRPPRSDIRGQIRLQ